MAQTPFDGKQTHYLSKQDSIHITYGDGGRLEVAMPVYTYRKTVNEIRLGRSYLIQLNEVSRQLASANIELSVQKVRTVNTTVEVNLQRQQVENQRATFEAREINLTNDFNTQKKMLITRTVSLETKVKEQKYKGVKGFLLGLGVGILGTITTAIVIAK